MDSFQDTIFKLKRYWADRGAVIQEPYDVEVGAGTMAPETFFACLGPKPYKVAYVQPSRRPADGRYGENPNRLYKHQQLQVMLKPTPDDVIEQYLGSLEAIGIDLRKHDIKFEEDNWESPTLGAWGIGWQVMLDGLEITQFTYFQQCGGIDLDLVPAEITYGLERIVAFLQNVESVYDIEWAPGVKYADVRLVEEQQFSVYNFEIANVDRLWRLFSEHEAECNELLLQVCARTSSAFLCFRRMIRSLSVPIFLIFWMREGRLASRSASASLDACVSWRSGSLRPGCGSNFLPKRPSRNGRFSSRNRHGRDSGLDDRARARRSAEPVSSCIWSIRRVGADNRGYAAAPRIVGRKTCRRRRLMFKP